MSADPISISSFKAPAPGQADAIGVSGRRCLEPEDAVLRRAFVCVVFLYWFPGHHSASVGESMERLAASTTASRVSGACGVSIRARMSLATCGGHTQ